MTIRHALKTLGIVGVGTGIGAAAALLFAPQSGRRTRRDLKRFGARQVDRVRDLGEDITGYMGNRSQWLREKIGARAS
jgi:gas vesicle protein